MIFADNKIIDIDDLRNILLSQQSMIIEMQDKLDTTLPRLESELESVKEENFKLNNTVYEQEQQLKSLHVKVYQCNNHNKGSYAEFNNRIKFLNAEMQKMDTTLHMLILQLSGSSGRAGMCRAACIRTN